MSESSDEEKLPSKKVKIEKKSPSIKKASSKGKNGEDESEELISSDSDDMDYVPEKKVKMGKLEEDDETSESTLSSKKRTPSNKKALEEQASKNFELRRTKQVQFKKQFLEEGDTPIPYQPPSTTKLFDEDVESDEDTETNNKIPTPPSFMAPLIEKGFRLKLLANVYLKRLHKNANVFIPYYILKYKNSNGEEQKKEDYFRASDKKNKICAFVSGGIQNTWEKTVEEVQEHFFKGERIKIIRSSWIQKHIFHKLDKDIEIEYAGRENELHSELYYEFFFKHFFLPDIRKQYPHITSLSIHAFSWWEVCNRCDNLLQEHKNLPGLVNIPVEYKIAANRRYSHSYSSNSLITEYRLQNKNEEPFWKQIWSKVTEYTKKHSDPFEEAKKKYFWTKTREGLDVCKWLGQAFKENLISDKWTTVRPAPKGDILKFFLHMQKENEEKKEINENQNQSIIPANPSKQEITPIKEFYNLLAYLQKVNWELSCWYKPTIDKMQNTWNRHWRQTVIPHFGWEKVVVTKDEKGASFCEMCGKKNLVNVCLAYHPKFRVSKKLLTPFEPQQKTKKEDDENKLKKLAFDESHYKRRQSLCVGMDCMGVLGLPYNIVEEKRQNKEKDNSKKKFKDSVERGDANRTLDEISNPRKKKKKK